MKKICVLLTLIFLLTGCGQQVSQSPTAQTASPENRFVSFDIYAVNDLHGKLADTDFQPGVDELSTYFQQAKDMGNTILLSTGDMWQGTSESNRTRGNILTEWMNTLDFAAMTLGGHEYDWGEDTIRQNRELADFPFLAINIYDKTTGKQADYCQSSAVLECAGAKIGIIGAIGDCYGSITPEHKQNVYFKLGEELTALVKAESEHLRSQGVDFIIYAIHDGFTENYNGATPLTPSRDDLKNYYDTTLSQGYVDLVFEADTHYSYVLTDPEGVYHLQAGGNNSGISHARVILDTQTGDAQVLTARILSASQYSYLEDHPVVEDLMTKYAAQIGSVSNVLGNNGQYLSGAGVCQLVADLYCQKALEKWGEDYDIVLGGGYISCRSPGYLPTGEVTYSQLQSLLPFDNKITLCSIKGRDLTAKFLETDNDAYYICLTPYGESIRGQIDPDGIYYVVTDTYSADYPYNNMTTVETLDATTFARDLLADYFQQGNR